jgi:hypothetical protein
MKKLWSPEDIAQLKREYSNAHTPTLAKQMDRTPTSVYQKALGMGLKKTTEYLATAAAGRIGKTNSIGTRFKKGHQTWNKGMKGWSPEGTQATWFQKGQMPKNHVPVGSTRILKDGYVEIKIAEPKSWALLHHKVWLDAGRELPEGYALRFRDGNKQNCSLDNLFLQCRADLMTDNTVHRYPRELKHVMRLTAKLTRRINEQH